KYDSAWASKTRQFIPWLIKHATISADMSVLDVACGPGYVSAAVKQLGALPTGIDFSEKMIAIAKKMFPDITFIQGDAQDLRLSARQGFWRVNRQKGWKRFASRSKTELSDTCEETNSFYRWQPTWLWYQRGKVEGVLRTP